MAPKIQRQDGSEQTPLAFELSHTLPLVDPEQGDDLTVTDSEDVVRPLYAGLLGGIPEYQQRGLEKAPVRDGPGTRIDKVLDRILEAFEDHAHVIRRRGGQVHAVSTYTRLDPMTVRCNLLVGALIGGLTLRRAFWDIGIRVTRGSFREDTPTLRRQLAAKGYTIEESSIEPGLLEVVFTMGETRP